MGGRGQKNPNNGSRRNKPSPVDYLLGGVFLIVMFIPANNY